MPYKFSPSSLHLLSECPRCFWLHFNLKMKRPDTIFPSLPGGMDRILKNHFDIFRKRNKQPPEFKEAGINAELFKDTELLKKWRNVFRGIQYTDEKGNLFRGAIDDILQKGKKLIVLDYKTRGFPLKEDTAAHYQNQLDIYNFLLRKNGYDTEDYAYLMFYYPKEVNEKGNFVFNSKAVKMKVDVKNAENIFKEAIKLLERQMPEASEDCGYCKWTANTQKF